MKNEIERRFVANGLKKDAETRTIQGYAALFDSPTDMGWFSEVIARGAFDGIDTDTVALFNHDPNIILGRKSAGTLRLKVDERGLHMEVDLPNTSHGNDLNELVSRGDIKHQSFAFTVLDDEWALRDGKDTRTIKKLKHLYDVSPVVYPASPDTTVAKRSKDMSGAIAGDSTSAIADENTEIEMQLILNRHEV